MSPPRATVRLQLHRDFPFAEAEAQIPYLARLGISDLYVSPILTARSGSAHGYDVVDHGAVNPELGGEEGLRSLVRALRAHQMGLIVDIVPNHMAVGGHDNRAWLDLLEWGPESRYARFFDVDWDANDAVLRNRIHAPFLGKPYGEALADGEITLVFDDQSGRFRFEYYEHWFPLAPRTYLLLMRVGTEALTPYEHDLREALAEPRARRGDGFTQVCHRLAVAARSDGKVAEAIAALLARANSRDADGFALLDHLLDRQHYRLAWWRTASDEINWRRFFDVINLAGVRIQETPAFEISHATLFRLYGEGLVDGFRIDHIDGLADPRRYCRQLRRRLNRLAAERPDDAPGGRPYIIVEKILAPGEKLASDWEVDGTSGYSFMNEVGALLHDPAGEEPLAELWVEFSGRAGDFEAEERRARRRIPQELLAADFNACAHALHQVARARPETRDWTLFAIRRVLAEMLVQFPVYRTYADARGRSEADDEIMRRTVEAARPQCEAGERPLLDAISNWLGGEAPVAAASSTERRNRLRAIARFQQLSSPVAAKSVEDTAFYRYGVLLSRNEVGANPGQFALSPEAFHAEIRSRDARFPHALLATATHDHKRGEDLRARLAVLSELPDRWRETVRHWSQLNGGFKRRVNGEAWPDAADEYMLYQMLAAAWPPQLELADEAGLQALRDRLAGWQTKALREAKRQTSWLQPNADYEAAAGEFLARLLDPAAASLFLSELYQFVQSIAAAGVVNSLTQTTLRLTSIGVPDLYQGCELWDFSLVDPDNRRPVDYALREQLLGRNDSSWSELAEHWRDGRIKLTLINRLLTLRQQHARLFEQGDYLSLAVVGEQADHLFAFARYDAEQNQALLVLVTRLANGLVGFDRPLIAAERWGDTRVLLPEPLQGLTWRGVVHEGSHEAAAALPAGLVLNGASVAVLQSG